MNASRRRLSPIARYVANYIDLFGLGGARCDTDDAGSRT